MWDRFDADTRLLSRLYEHFAQWPEIGPFEPNPTYMCVLCTTVAQSACRHTFAQAQS